MDDQLRLGWRGFDKAERELLDEVRSNGDSLVPLGHLLQWAYAIDQWHTKRIDDGPREIIQLFGADIVGETYNGFRAARASVAHDLSLVADLVTRSRPRIIQAGGAGRRAGSVIITGATSIQEWLWIDTPAISANDKGLPSYQKHLAGKPISDCLPAVREFLEVRLPNLLSQKPKPT
jgi:hypothetical protein